MAPRWAPRDPQGPPRGPQEASKDPERAPRRPPRVHKRPQRPPKSSPRRPLWVVIILDLVVFVCKLHGHELLLPTLKSFKEGSMLAG